MATPYEPAAEHSDPSGLHPDVARHLPRNYTAHAIEGGLYMGGLAFAHPQTVLPRMVEQLGGPDWMIALAPVLLMIGFSSPSLFVTHRIERLAALKPFVMWTGALQRLPYLLAGGALLAAQPGSDFTLCIILVTPLLSGFVGGISVSAWREFVAKTVPATRLASLWAVRFLLGGVLGVIAGDGVAYVLGHYPATRAYGVLHLAVFALMALSWGIFASTREPALDSRRARSAPTWLDYARSLRDDLARDARLRSYLCSRALFGGLFVMTPFLSIHALEALHAPESFLGRLLTCQMLGSLAGNLAGGYLGDRYGGKPLLVAATLAGVGLSLGAMAAHTPPEFQIAFLLLGLTLGFSMVAMPTLDVEISPHALRMSYQTMIALAYLGGTLGAALVAGAVRRLTGRFEPLALIASALLVSSLAVLLGVKDPRRKLA